MNEFIHIIVKERDIVRDAKMLWMTTRLRDGFQAALAL